MKSVKYFLKFFWSSSRRLLAKSAAVSAGQFCEGKKTETRYSWHSPNLAL